VAGKVIKITTFCKLFSYILFKLELVFCALILILRMLKITKNQDGLKFTHLIVTRKRFRVENFRKYAYF